MKPKNTFKRNTQPSSLASESGNLYFAYNGIINSSELVTDISGNGRTGTPSSTLLQKDDGFYFPETVISPPSGLSTAFINLPTVNCEKVHTILFTGKFDNFTARVFLSYSSTVALYFVNPTSFIYRTSSAPSETATFTIPSAILLGQEISIAVTRNDASVSLYINGNFISTQTLAVSVDASFQRVGYGTSSNSFIGTIRDIRVYKSVLSLQRIIEYYNIMKKTIISDCFCNDEVGATKPYGWDTNAVYGVIEQNTTFKTPNMPVGSKIFKITSSATGLISIPSNAAFGTWEFSFEIPASKYCITRFINIGNVGGNQGYALILGTASGYPTLGISLVSINSAGLITSITKSSDNYIAADTTYDMKVTRDYSGKFTMYIRGGAFGNLYQLVNTSALGSNPIVNALYTTSETFAVSTAITTGTNCKFGAVKIIDRALEPAVLVR